MSKAKALFAVSIAVLAAPLLTWGQNAVPLVLLVEQKVRNRAIHTVTPEFPKEAIASGASGLVIAASNLFTN